MILTILILIFIAVLAHSAVLHNGIVIPTYAKVCKRCQPDINNCLKDSIQTVIKKIGPSGIKQANIASLDPLKINEYSFRSKFGNQFQIGATVTDVYSFGFSKVQILGVRFNDPKNIAMDIHFLNPNALIYGNYNIEGLISETPIIGKGKFRVIMRILKIKGHIANDYGDEYLKIKHSLMRPYVTDMKIEMTTGNTKYPRLIKLFSAIVNQFWQVIYRELLPHTEKKLDEIFSTVINTATLKIPFNQLIPQ